MRSSTRLNILYAQSGGVTPVINATAAAVISTARTHRNRIGRVLAARNGILGVLQERLIDTAQLKQSDLDDIENTPGGVFGSCRHKLAPIKDDQQEYERLIDVFRAHDIGCFFYNGGNDSADTALKISQLGRRAGFPLQCIGIPKTIDNDLAVTDNSPGFGSVAKYVAVSIAEASHDVMAMASSSTRVFIMEVMGRHAGWIAAAAGLAVRRQGDGPQIIVFPEVPFNEQRFCQAVRTAVERYGFCSIVVSEGARYSDGRFLAEAGTRDVFGHRQLGGAGQIVAAMIGTALGYKCQWAVCNYLQRSARHLASQTDLDHAHAVGKAAVELALEGHSGVMPVIRRQSSEPYRWTIEAAPLGRIANREKRLPKRFISADGFGITPSCRAYLAPLIRGEAFPPYGQDGLPGYVRPQLAELPPRLAPLKPLGA